MTDKESRAAALENRVSILAARKKDNGNIIRKLNRQIRNLRKEG